MYYTLFLSVLQYPSMSALILNVSIMIGLYRYITENVENQFTQRRNIS